MSLSAGCSSYLLSRGALTVSLSCPPHLYSSTKETDGARGYSWTRGGGRSWLRDIHSGSHHNCCWLGAEQLQTGFASQRRLGGREIFLTSSPTCQCDETNRGINSVFPSFYVQLGSPLWALNAAQFNSVFSRTPFVRAMLLGTFGLERERNKPQLTKRPPPPPKKAYPVSSTPTHTPV